MKTIVVGTDFNELATAALRFAGGLAARSGAELIVVYADTFEPPVEFTAAQLSEIAEAIERSRKAAAEELKANVARYVPQGVAWRAIVADGLPAAAISAVADAEGADFIVVGTHGRGGLQRLLLGSVAEALIRDAHVPVLTVHSTDGVRRVISHGANADLAASLARDLGAEFIASEGPRLQIGAR